MAPGGARVVNNCEECLRSRSFNMKVLRGKDDTVEEDVNLNSIVDIYASKFYLRYNSWLFDKFFVLIKVIWPPVSSKNYLSIMNNL